MAPLSISQRWGGGGFGEAWASNLEEEGSVEEAHARALDGEGGCAVAAALESWQR
jgi:hypothetical protein